MEELTVKDIAKTMKVEERSVTRYIKSGQLKATIELNDRGQKKYVVSDKDFKTFQRDRQEKSHRVGSGLLDGQSTPEATKSKTDSPTLSDYLIRQVDELKQEVKTKDRDHSEKLAELNLQIASMSRQFGAMESEIKLLKPSRQSETDTSKDNVSDIQTTPDIQPQNNKTVDTRQVSYDKNVLKWIVGGFILIVIIGGGLLALNKYGIIQIW